MRFARLNPPVFLLAFVSACDPLAAPDPTTSIAMSFPREGGLWDAPFPSDDLLLPDGRVDLSKYPNPDRVQLVAQSLGLLAPSKGFAASAGIYFSASAPIDPASLPTITGSLAHDASVYLAEVGTNRPEPIDVAFLDDGGPYGAPNMIAVLPVQGRPLKPGRTYAAVVTTRVRDVNGRPLQPSPAVADLVAGHKPPGLDGAAYERYRGALPQLAKYLPGADVAQIAAIAVFTTGSPTAELDAVVADMRARPRPTIAAPKRTDVYADYCVYQSTVSLPVYQDGTPPYQKEGGAWRFDAGGKPILDHVETARVLFTVPRAKAPSGGWPLAIFVRTGGGGDRPLVDRGVAASPEFMMPVEPGSGPACDLARVGFAGAQVDGPLGGMRNPSGADEQFLVFNVFNPSALRDNVRQSAAELALFSDVVAPFRFDASDCPGVGPGEVGFDGAHLALMGHSMGAWIAPLASVAAPKIGALVLSGAGGSYIANVMDKQHPTPVRMFAQILLGYQDRPLTNHDPGLSLLQWAAEPSDPQVYDARVVAEPDPGTSPRHVLMVQGIVDHYILPSIANATSLALGLDQGGPAYDVDNMELAMLKQTPLQTLLPLANRSQLKLPAMGNIDGKTTALVVQHPGDGIQDGHEVFFQTEPPKHQFRCFLASWLKGVPVVPPDGAAEAPCP